LALGSPVGGYEEEADMTLIRAGALAAGLMLAGPGWAADTDVENPNMRELPLQRSPIMGGRQHQPTPTEIEERAQLLRSQQPSTQVSNAPAAAPGAKAPGNDDLYQRVLRQSQRATPRTIDPSGE
jgi:hypothetical protein